MGWAESVSPNGMGRNGMGPIFVKFDETRWGQSSHLIIYQNFIIFYQIYLRYSSIFISYADSANDATNSGPLSKKVTQNGYFKWNKDLKHVLAKEVFQAHYYKVKWRIVLKGAK